MRRLLLALPVLAVTSGCYASATVTAGPVVIDPQGQRIQATVAAPTAASSGGGKEVPAPAAVQTVARGALIFTPASVVVTAVDVDKLEKKGLPHDFGNFLKLTLGAPDRKAECTKRLSVSAATAEGFAWGSSGTSCQNEPSRMFWKRNGAVWQTVWEGKEPPPCTALRNAAFPADIADIACMEQDAETKYKR